MNLLNAEESYTACVGMIKAYERRDNYNIDKRYIAMKAAILKIKNRICEEYKKVLMNNEKRVYYTYPIDWCNRED